MVPKFVKKALAALVRQGNVSAVNDDTSAYPTMLVKSSGKETEATRLSVYGVCSNPPSGSHVLLIASQGQESVKFGIPNDMLNRKKSLAEGEVVLFNCLTGDFVLMKADGTIEIESSVKVKVTAPETEIVGNLVVTGDITATGDITGAELKVPGKPDYTVHVHPGVTSGPSNTGTPV
jgi:phage gp45-like